MATVARIDSGLEYARNKLYGNAEKEFTSLIIEDSTNADAFYYRGCVYIHLSEYEKAINDFNIAICLINLSPKHELSVLYKRGYAKIKANQFDSALDDYRHYLKQCESDTKLKNLIHKGLFQMGIIYAALNQYESAIDHFTKAIDSSTNTEEAKQKLYYLYRGRAYACCANYTKAQEDLSLVLAQSKDSFIKGCAYNELGQHQDALREFDSLTKPNENKSKLAETFNDHILFRRGVSYGCLKKHEEALRDFQHALQDSAQSASNITDRILFRKGMSNMALDNSHQALIDFNQSTELKKNQSDVFYARSMLHYTLGRYDAAVYDQYKAMELERRSLPLASDHKTMYYPDKNGTIHNNYIYYKNRIHEAKDLLKNNKDKDTLKEADLHRLIAEYSQKQASYSNDSLGSYKSARGHIKTARTLSNGSQIEDSVAFFINSLCRAQCLDKKYSNGNMPVSIMEEYIKYQAEYIMGMSNLFDECVLKRNWSDIIKTLLDECHKSNIQQICRFDEIRIEYAQNQLKKVKMIQKSINNFADSPAQQEFYQFLVIRLCNLFDGVRIASTGIFSHSLEGTFTKVSWAFKLLGKLSQFAPIGSEYGKKVFGLCESGFKKLDETRIENTLNYMGSLDVQTKFNETADAIAIELTNMYKNQIKRFPTKSEEDTIAAADSNQQQQNCCTKCASCFKRCGHCLSRTKHRITNKAEQTIIQTVVEYGVSLFLICLTSLSVDDIPNLTDIQNVFVNAVCRPSKMNVAHAVALVSKLKLKNDKDDKEDEYWNPYDFFRRPAICFKDKTVRARNKTDEEIFGCRKPTSEEEVLLKTKPEELDKYGFKIITNK
ncbi:unnamed protein product [Adineta steineri]|uniref:Uncharacterized protein n=1 Tax=Adineta steineri TaxID=433720 RepID=A0A813RPZ5_9BILA|nr:unnamed protein product [Adineta steineri]CAF3814634.1 unnamed protein product [Adineta steineri]